MKKVFCLLVSLMLMVFPCMCMASDGTAAQVLFDLTDVLIALLMLGNALAVASIVFVWKRWIGPWLEKAGLSGLADEFIGWFFDFGVQHIAQIVVHAVEANMGRGNGDGKWEEALQKMKKWGFRIDDERVIDALKAAWKKLDLAQLMAGEKQPKTDEATKA